MSFYVFCFSVFAQLLSIIKDRKFGFTLKMRTQFQFHMPTFLMETCLTLRFTFCNVSPKIVTNSIIYQSCRLVKSIVGSWTSLLTGSFSEKLVNQIYKHWHYTHPNQLIYNQHFFPFTNLLVGNILRYKTTWRNEESVWKPEEIHPFVGNSPKANLWSLVILNMKVL